jgi:hypothetical protein
LIEHLANDSIPIHGIRKDGKTKNLFFLNVFLSKNSYRAIVLALPLRLLRCDDREKKAAIR